MHLTLNLYLILYSFNTASGKYYCNVQSTLTLADTVNVSIPQAVSTIAMAQILCTQTNPYLI